MSGSKRSIVDDELLDWVIREEGFIEKPRNIGDGKITLGSGLTDPKWHRLYRQRGNKWSKEDNRTAVREELEKRKKWAEDTIPNWDSLPEHSQKAMLSYKYNFDFTPKNSPLLFQAMTDGRFIDAMYQMDATSKDPKFKKGLEKRRKREQEWGLTELLEKPKRNPFEGYLEEFPDMVFVNNPYKIGTNNRIPKPVVMPIASDNYVEAVSLPDERPNIDALRAISQIGNIMHFNESMKWENQPQPTHFVSTNQPDYVAHSEGGSLNKKTWDSLSLTEKSEMMRVAIENGITNLSDIKKKYNEFAEGGGIEEIVEKVNSSKAPFVQRLKDPNRKYIQDWAYKNMIATHKLGVGTDEQGNHYIYPEVQEINGKLVDFTRPPYASWVGQVAAEERGDTVRVPSIEDGLLFTENYKKYYPKGKTFAEGGPKGEQPDSIELHTWRPLVDSSYKMTGHSALNSPARTFVEDPKYNNVMNGTDAIGINFVPQMPEYNLITNNCSDATRRALEAISGKRINPVFFTTPGNVKDFAEQELGGRSFYRNGHYVTRIPVTQKQRDFLSSFSPYSTSSEGVRMKADGGPIRLLSKG